MIVKYIIEVVVRDDVFQVDISQATEILRDHAEDLRHHPASNGEPLKCLKHRNNTE